MTEPRNAATTCADCPCTDMLLALHRARGELIIRMGDDAENSPTMKSISDAIEKATGRRT